MTKYAEGTDVPIPKSKIEVETLLKRAGATQFFCGDTDTGDILVGCKLSGRVLRFTIPFPTMETTPGRHYKTRSDSTEPWEEKELRRRWRCLVLAIKAKLAVVETGMKTLEEEFLSDVVMADNRTVYEHVSKAIEETYSTGKVRGPLLLGPATGGR